MTPEEFKKICADYDAAPDDFGWDESHPIFSLAQENDILNERVRELNDKIKWAAGQFQGIRLYTKDGKTAVACAEAETKLKS